MNTQGYCGVRGPRGLYRRRVWPTALLLAAATGLQGCGKGVEPGATSNPVAPGRPGTGNPVVQVAPVMPGSITESPGIGGSRGLIPEGATGDASPPAEARRPGVGLDGGLAGGAAGAGPAAAASGSAPGAGPGRK
ncbi:hypothetical protein [Ramlibacter sp. AN1133]|uniref:hypothetical protein n=1 Tax=Ramlibacter sp. AN1133 TaxID=3133429 RepID=UPI0030BCD64E